MSASPWAPRIKNCLGPSRDDNLIWLLLQSDGRALLSETIVVHHWEVCMKGNQLNSRVATPRNMRPHNWLEYAYLSPQWHLDTE